MCIDIKLDICQKHYDTLPPHVKERPTAKHLLCAIEIAKLLREQRNEWENRGRRLSLQCENVERDLRREKLEHRKHHR